MKALSSVMLALIVIASTGCESRQQKAARLEKIADDLEKQYRQDCFDPYGKSSGAGVKEALHSSRSTPEQKTDVTEKAREQEARVNSAHCKDLAARKKEAAQAWNAALQ